MDVVFHHAWMQKHPTPTNASGDFHWHPASVPAAIRTTLSDLATRARGQAASVWIIDGGYVAWARAFSAISPSDRRRYTGLAATIAQGDASLWSRALPEILARLPLAEAGPYAGQAPRHAARVDDMPGGTEPLAIDPGSLASLFEQSDHGLAAAIYLGGPVACREPHAERLPALVGRLLSWLPEAERARPRTGVVLAGPTDDERGHGGAMDNLLHYLTAAWRCPEPIRRRQPGFATQAWQLVFDLAAGAGCTLPELFADLTAVAAAWDTADHLRRHLVQRGALSERDLAECDRRAPAPLAASPDAGWLWNRLLHYWGRGFVPEDALPRLAALLARRVTADHLFHLDAPEQASLPRRYLRRLTYEALLPRARVASMRAAVERLLPSLSREVQLV